MNFFNPLTQDAAENPKKTETRNVDPRLIRSSMTARRCDGLNRLGSTVCLRRSPLLGENTCDHWQRLKAQLRRWDRRRAEIRRGPPNTWGGGVPWDRDKSGTMEISSVTDWQRRCSCSVVGDVYSLFKGLLNHRKQIERRVSGNKLMLICNILIFAPEAATKSALSYRSPRPVLLGEEVTFAPKVPSESPVHL